MHRIVPSLVMLTAAPALLLLACGRGDAQDGKWGTIKGQVVWGGKAIPARKEILVAADKAHCLLKNPTADPCKGTILEEVLLINEKTKGILNAFVWLLNDVKNPLPIHPNLKKLPQNPMTIDQPACMFSPRAVAMREGQVFEVKNSAPVPHNILWTGDGVNNQGGNVLIKPGGKLEIKNLKAQFLPLSLSCSLHGWMRGRLAVFDHPYFAITDENGNFEIKDAPVGNLTIMIYHEDIGYRVGKMGEPINIKGGVNDMGKLPMGGKN
jgi:hypothetical protein